MKRPPTPLTFACTCTWDGGYILRLLFALAFLILVSCCVLVGSESDTTPPKSFVCPSLVGKRGHRDDYA